MESMILLLIERAIVKMTSGLHNSVAPLHECLRTGLPITTHIQKEQREAYHIARHCISPNQEK